VVTPNAPILRAEIIKRALVLLEKRQKINKAGVRVSCSLRWPWVGSWLSRWTGRQDLLERESWKSYRLRYSDWLGKV
jgi:hypothetical protein